MNDHQATHDAMRETVLLYLAAKRKRAPTIAATSQAVSKVFARGAAATKLRDDITKRIDECVGAGEVTRTGSALSLSPAGRAQCTALFNLPLPTEKNWTALKRLLLMRALTGDAQRSPGARGFGGATGLASAVLNQQEGLLPQALPTPTQVANALAWRELGGDPAVRPTWPAARRLLLSRLLQAPKEMKESSLIQHLAASRLGITVATQTAIEAGILNHWLQAPASATPSEHGQRENADNAAAHPQPPPPTAPDPVMAEQDGSDFLTGIRTAIADDSTVRFFGSKAFIASVFDAFCHAGGGLDWEAFCDQLLQAHRTGQLRLTRADLIPAMDTQLVARSAVHYQNATFHFVEPT